MDVVLDQLGAVVKERRKALGLRQEDLAKAIGLSRASVANIETGRQDTPWSVIVKLMYALDVKTLKRPTIETKTVTLTIPVF